METKSETIQIYKKYIEHYLIPGKKLLYEIEQDIKKLEEKSFFINFLEIFIKNESFPKEYLLKILNSAYSEKGILYNEFLTFLIFNFLNYIKTKTNKEQLVNSWKQNKKPVFDIILSFLLGNIDRIDNYYFINKSRESINQFYNQFFEVEYKIFLNYCLNEEKKLDDYFNLTIEYLDFALEVEINNNKYLIYKYIKQLFFEITPKENKRILEQNIKNYKDKLSIINCIYKFISNNLEIKTENFTYLNFIINHVEQLGIEVNYESNDFKIAFLSFLNENNLKIYFQNNPDKIRNFNLKDILEVVEDKKIKNNNDKKINEENQDKEEIITENETKQNEENINKLKNKLDKRTVKQYFTDQYNKYSKYLKDSNTLMYLSKIENKEKLVIPNFTPKKNFPIISKYISFLEKYQLSDLSANYMGKDLFGIVVINGNEYLYGYNKQEILNDFTFNIINIKKSSYKEIIKKKNENKNNSYSKENGKNNESYNLNKSINNNYIKANSVIMNKINDNLIENKSIASNNNNKTKSATFNKDINNNSNNSNSDKTSTISNVEEGYEIRCFIGHEFENNSNNFFKNMFNLTDLPLYFFKLNYNINKNLFKKNKMYTFSEYNKILFSIFLEADGAYINKKDMELTQNLSENYCPYLIHKTFNVYKDNEENKENKENHKFRISIANETLKIENKTIVISESKVSIPNNIENFSFKKQYTVNDLENSLLLTIYKLIKKINFYKEYVKNEILENNEKINDYKFHLFLIYNNTPVSDLEQYIEVILEDLISHDFIKQEFKLQILYLIPSLGSYNINTIQREMGNIKKKYDDIKNENNDIKKKYDEIKIELEDLRKILKEYNLIKKKINLFVF